MAAINGIPGLQVRLRVRDDGSVSIEGQHLGAGAPGGSEYEYGFSIAAADVPRLAAALGTEVPGIPAAWDEQVQSIASTGERRWLTEHDVTFSFWSRID